MNFRENISGREDAKPLNMIMKLNAVRSGERAGKGFMVHAELDQSGFVGLTDGDGKVNTRKIAHVEPEPRLTTAPAYITVDMARKFVEKGNFAKDDKGNYIGSVTTTMTHGLGKGVWVPDPDNISGKGWRDTKSCKTADELYERREMSRASASTRRDYDRAMAQPEEVNVPDLLETANKEAVETIVGEATKSEEKAVPAVAVPEVAVEQPAEKSASISDEMPF